MTIRKILAIIFFCFCAVLFFWTKPFVSQKGTIKIWDRNHILLYESAGTVGKNIPVRFDEFPKSLISATVTSEDETFWKNPGIDAQAIVRSAYLDITNRKIVSGASTITQQLARMSIVSSQESSSEIFIRKIREVIMALRLNFRYNKKEIMTMYLNRAYYGNMAYGAEAASRFYFNKDVGELSLAESAFLAGLVSAPGSRNPFSSFTAAKQRQTDILDLMVKHDIITKAVADQAKQEKLAIAKTHQDIKAPHFVVYALSTSASYYKDTGQGVNVYTTLDYPTYLLSADIASLWVDRLKNQHDLSNASLVLIKNNTGEILDLLGGIDYFDKNNAGEVDMATALRQPGSALKPVTYAAAFMQGYTPATLIYDVPKVYKTKKGEGYMPNNYDGRYHGLVLAREALASSLNLPAVEMLNRIGISNFLNIAHRMGITTLNQENRYDLSLTLGGGEVTLLDLTNVFASFARGGQYKPPYAIEKITDDDGKMLYQHAMDPGLQVLGKTGEQVAYLISSILSDPQARLLGFYEKNPLVLSHPAAVKTGTTTDWHDNWTVGYTPSYTVGVWVGNTDNHPMKDITGVVGAAPIWHQFFEEFLKDKPTEQFIKPSGIKTVRICKLTGLLPDTLCPYTMDEMFISGTEPRTKTSIYKQVNIDKRNGLLAGSMCPAEFTQKVIRIDYPPELYTWAEENDQDMLPKQFSPLCDIGQTSVNQNFISITYPRAKIVFQNAPDLVSNQAAVFEVSVSGNITAVEWFVDGKSINTTASFPYSASWYPAIGTHTVQAIGINTNGERIKSDKIPFSVVDYSGY